MAGRLEIRQAEGHRARAVRSPGRSARDGERRGRFAACRDGQAARAAAQGGMEKVMTRWLVCIVLLNTLAFAGAAQAAAAAAGAKLNVLFIAIDDLRPA